MLNTLSLLVLGCHVRVRCQDAEIRALLVANYGHMQGSRGPATLQYTIARQARSGGFWLSRAGREALSASDPGMLLFLFEKDMTDEIEKLRPDLYFVHAAVLALEHAAVMLVGESGSGKSTTAWALLHHSCRYFSDELGPVDLQTGDVHPYPHALCLKDVPPRPYALPKNTLYTARTLHIPTAALPSTVGEAPTPSRRFSPCSTDRGQLRLSLSPSARLRQQPASLPTRSIHWRMWGTASTGRSRYAPESPASNCSLPISGQPVPSQEPH
jgi:hypothetical protein